MADPSRLYDGFNQISGGVDGGQSPSLIGPDQAAFAINLTFRGSYPTPRPIYANIPINVPDNLVSRWTGKYQGHMPYDGESGQSGWIVSRGGKLFFIPYQTRVLAEITPQLPIVTTADFTVPAPAATVLVAINSETAIATGETVYIDSGQYTVTNRFLDELLLTYIGGAANAVALAGNSVNDTPTTQIIEFQTNPSDFDFIFMFQAENYGIILAGQHKTIIFNGSTCRQAGLDEIPPGVLGVYGWGRIWICNPDRRTFVAGDLVFGPSGTVQNGFRDAILKFTENDFLNEGGTFGVPYNAGPITAMQFLAAQDTSLGTGVLLVTTTNMVFSVNAPVDRTTWKNLTYPIQSIALLDYGPEGPRSAVPINGDMWYRSSDGFRSFIVARRLFGSPGNTPMSHEISPIVDEDDDTLLFYGSGMFFDNRLLQTVSPVWTANGIIHRGLVAMNFDEVSNLRQKLPAIWEGLWTGLNVLQVSKARINQVERGFIFAWGSDIEIWEIVEDGYYDLIAGARNQVPAVMETRSHDFTRPFDLKWLRMFELYADEIVDNAAVTVKFRPDQYPGWTTWGTINFCAPVSQCDIISPLSGACAVWKMRARQYSARATLGQPPELCNAITNRPLSWGHEFQLRLEITGCRLRMARIHANVQTVPMEGQCQSSVTCTVFEDCGNEWFTYDSHGDNVFVIGGEGGGILGGEDGGALGPG